MPYDIPTGASVGDLPDHEIAIRAVRLTRMFTELARLWEEHFEAESEAEQAEAIVRRVVACVDYRTYALTGHVAWLRSRAGDLADANAHVHEHGLTESMPTRLAAVFWCAAAVGAEESFWALFRGSPASGDTQLTEPGTHTLH